ncbi:MAG: hypothetical protein RIA69_07985 [Cyclobacteriaceae bacterium]
MLLVLLCLLTSVDQKLPVIYKTVSLWNEHYYKPSIDNRIAFDMANGEDVNSERFGGMPYRVLKAQNSLIPAPTISLNYLEIAFDLENLTDESYLIDRIIVQPSSNIPLQTFKGTTGSYHGILNSSGFLGAIEIPLNKIDEESTYYPKGLTLAGKNEMRDSRIKIAISARDQLKAIEDCLFEFQIEIKLIPISGEGKPMTVVADKNYYLVIIK